MDKVVGIVLGAGSGARVGTAVNKIYLPIGGTPMLVRSARAFARHPDVDELHVVAARHELDLCRTTLADAGIRPDAILAGGATRHDSELAAVEGLAPRIAAGEIGVVLIHDGARPLVAQATIAGTIATAREHGAAIAAVPVERPLAVVHDGLVVGRCKPDGLWRAQTPQGFDARLLLDAFRRARADGFAGSDTAMTFERLGLPVRLIDGSERNVKVTYPIDLARAEAALLEDDGR